MSINGITQQIIRQIDRNNTKQIDNQDDLELAQMFGFKENDKLNEKTQINTKILNYDKKMDVYSKAMAQGNKPASENVMDYANQLALMKKGLSPDMLKESGFEAVSIIDTEDGTKLVLKSNDGYELEINDVQDENNTVIKRNEDGKLLLSGVKGNLNITKASPTGHEIILSNIYEDNCDEPTLTVTNNSNSPLTKTYPKDSKGELSYDAARALNEQGFPSTQAVYGHFTQVSVTEDPNGGRKDNLNLSSDEHGFVLNFEPIWEGDQPYEQPNDMLLHYSKSNNRLTASKLVGPANLDITEDGNSKHEIFFSNSEINAENKTRKPCHVRQMVMKDENNEKVRDNSSFTYKTSNNFDTFDKQRVDSVDLEFKVPGKTQIRMGKVLQCSMCGGATKDALITTKGNAKTVDIHLGNRVVTTDKVTIAPGDYIIKPDEETVSKSGKVRRKKPEYTKDERLHQLTCNDNGKNDKISYIRMNDFVKTKASIESTGQLDNGKISRSGVNWSAIGVSVTDNSTNVNGDNNIVMVQHGNNNTAQIFQNPVPIEQKTALLEEQYHLKPSMFKKAGFNDVSFNYLNGQINEIVFIDKANDVRLTLPADEAFMFSEQMKISKNRNGELELKNIVGTLEGTGMKINCSESNVHLSIVDHNLDKGYLRYSNNDNDKERLADAIYINYSGESVSTPDNPVIRTFIGDNKDPKKHKTGNLEFGSWVEYTTVDSFYGKQTVRQRKSWSNIKKDS